LQIIRNEVVKALLFGRGVKFLNQGMAVGERDVFKDLAAQGPLTDWLQTGLKVRKIFGAGQICELCLETFEITEGVVVNNANQTE